MKLALQHVNAVSNVLQAAKRLLIPFFFLVFRLVVSYLASKAVGLDILVKLETFLFYKQKKHIFCKVLNKFCLFCLITSLNNFMRRWLTTASGYLRLLLFGKNMTKAQEAKLHRITFYILLIYVPVPMFCKIHSTPRAPERPTNMLLWHSSN